MADNEEQAGSRGSSLVDDEDLMGSGPMAPEMHGLQELLESLRTGVRRAREFAGLADPEQEIPLGLSGVNGTNRIEPQPIFNRLPCEELWGDHINGGICAGYDRPEGAGTGYGAAGHTQCSMLDFSVGRMAMSGPRTVDEQGHQLYAESSFKETAVRMYMSEKSDIDPYLEIRAGRVGTSPKATSSWAVIADNIRLCSRHGMKLVTRPFHTNSKGHKIEQIKGIDLMAGNDDSDMQPLVKGENLVEALGIIVDWISGLNGIVDGILLQQQKINTVLSMHTHTVPLPGFPAIAAPMPLPTGPPALGVPGSEVACGEIFVAAAIDQLINGSIAVKFHRVKGEFLKFGNFKQWARNYICSRHNNTN